MIVVDVHLRADMVVRRRFDLLDSVEIAGQSERITIHIDPKSAIIAADMGASLLASSRRQQEPEGGGR